MNEMFLLGLAFYWLTRPRAAAASEAPTPASARPRRRPRALPPAQRPAARPAARQPTRPAARPPVRPAARAATRQGARPATRPAGSTIRPGRVALAIRAGQPAAAKWTPYLLRNGAPDSLAAGLVRWIGIESSGRPTAQSRLGERGLLQIMPASARLALTPAEWASLANPRTSPDEHARIAIKQFRWHVRRAGIDEKRPIEDQLWYAKAHHTRPADLRVTSARPAARMAARYMATRATTPAQKRRLAVANTVAFGAAAVSGDDELTGDEGALEQAQAGHGDAGA